MDDSMSELVGKRIVAVEVSVGETFMRVLFDGGEAVYEAEGDCCSETWFAEIIGVEALLGHVVNAARDIELPTVADGNSRQEEDIFYGLELTTDAGRCKIVYRNSSHGYYGGTLIGPVDAPKGVAWKRIEDDWTAYAAR